MNRNVLQVIRTYNIAQSVMNIYVSYVSMKLSFRKYKLYFAAADFSTYVFNHPGKATLGYFLGFLI